MTPPAHKTLAGRRADVSATLAFGSTIRWNDGQDAPPGIPDVDSAPPYKDTDPV